MYYCLNFSDNWSHNETKFMLGLYREYMEQIGPGKKFPDKRTMWKIIADELQDKYVVERSSEEVIFF